LILAGIAISALYPVRRHLVGAILVGAISVTIFFAVIMVAGTGWFSLWHRREWLMIGVAALCIGPLFGYLLRRNRREEVS
jgi:predicted small integral membrane protein